MTEIDSGDNKVCSADLKSCPFCGGKALPVVVFFAGNDFGESQFWGDANFIPDCFSAGCKKCGCVIRAKDWQKRV